MDRHFLSVTGGTLLGQRGSAGERRAGALADAVNGRAQPALSLQALADLPEWLRAPRETQADIARRAALLAIGPALARSIDGGWLKDLAEAAGEDALDWALAELEHEPADGEAHRLATRGDRLTGLGFGLAVVTLPAELRPLLDWTRPEPVGYVEAARAPAWIAAAQDAVA